MEITQPRLQQVQINPKINLTFASALRSFLRADPDVIFIGEMRDYETAHAGIESSLTGHLVFSTLHTNSAAETVTRLLDMGLDPLTFADAVIGVLAQRLVRRLCTACRAAYTPGKDEVEFLMSAYGLGLAAELNVDPARLTLYRAVGCPACRGTGYKGRTGIHELLVASRPVKALVAHRKPAAEVQQLAASEGMRTLRQDGIQKIVRGETDVEQVWAATVEA